MVRESRTGYTGRTGCTSRTGVLWLSLFFCVLLAGFPFVVKADGEVQVKASAPASVETGRQFRLTFTSNERIDDIQLPSMSAFTLLGGPSTSYQSSTQNINGKWTSTTSYSHSYYLQADKEGDWEIPSTTVKVRGKSYKTNPVRIHVSKGASGGNNASNGSGNASGGTGYGGNSQGGSAGSGGGSDNSAFNKNDFFIKAEVSKTNPYVEEEVLVHYKLYIGSAAQRYQANISKLPAFTGLWTYELGDRTAEKRPYRENLNGKSYSVVDLYDVALYPQKAGTLTISPLEVEMVVQIAVQRAQSNDPWANFFNNPFFGGNVQNIDLQVASKPLTLHVKELPAAGRPADFSGLVGSFSMRSELSRDALQANDATNFSIVISGKGNLQHVEAPQVNFPSDIDTHEPGVNDRIHSEIKSGVNGSRTFEYILIPREAGEFEIPQAGFSYFDPVQKQYVTLHSNPYTLKVSKGSADSRATVTSNKKDVKVLGSDIRFIRTDRTSLRPAGNRAFFLSPLYWLCMALPFLFFVLFVLLLCKKIRDKRNVVMIKDKRASKVARKRLKVAEKYMKSKDEAHFYEEISRVLWGYVGDKFHLPQGSLSLDAARQKLAERNMPPARIEEFVETLNQCEYVRFAPSAELTPEKMYEKTFAFITNMEAELSRRRA